MTTVAVLGSTAASRGRRAVISRTAYSKRELGFLLTSSFNIWSFVPLHHVMVRNKALPTSQLDGGNMSLNCWSPKLCKIKFFPSFINYQSAMPIQQHKTEQDR
jgi:hypothetical protein